MTTLTVCIPVEPSMAAPDHLVALLLADPASSVEIIIGGAAASAELEMRAKADRRLRILPADGQAKPAAMLWRDLVEAAEGQWITLVHPQDMIEPDLPLLLDHLSGERPDADSLGWNAFQIDSRADRAIAANVAVPMLHHLSDIDKSRMLAAYFQWEGARQVPLMPFGLFHGAIRRELATTILGACGPMSWQTLVPEHEWKARSLLFCSRMVLSNRPLSAVDLRPFQRRSIASALQGFPLGPHQGLTGAVAEVQARVLSELGGDWPGFGPDFVRACLFDCMMEHDRSAFDAKCQAYRGALRLIPGGAAFAADFQPPYYPALPADPRRGRDDATILVDRFICGARTAQDFYRAVNAMLTPVAIVVERPAPAEDSHEDRRRVAAV